MACCRDLGDEGIGLAGHIDAAVPEHLRGPATAQARVGRPALAGGLMRTVEDIRQDIMRMGYALDDLRRRGPQYADAVASGIAILARLRIEFEAALDRRGGLP